MVQRENQRARCAARPAMLLAQRRSHAFGMRVKMCRSNRGSAYLAVAPCTNVYVIVLCAVLCACELSLAMCACIRVKYRFGRVCDVF